MPIRFAVPINSRQWLSVSIHRTMPQLEKAVKSKKLVAAYQYTPDGRNPNKGEFGHLHFVKSHLGIGTVAHELQHFMFDWMRTKKPKNEEKLAALIENMTREFWNKYKPYSESIRTE